MCRRGREAAGEEQGSGGCASQRHTECACYLPAKRAPSMDADLTLGQVRRAEFSGSRRQDQLLDRVVVLTGVPLGGSSKVAGTLRVPSRPRSGRRRARQRRLRLPTAHGVCLLLTGEKSTFHGRRSHARQLRRAGFSGSRRQDQLLDRVVVLTGVPLGGSSKVAGTLRVPSRPRSGRRRARQRRLRLPTAHGVCLLLFYSPMPRPRSVRMAMGSLVDSQMVTPRWMSLTNMRTT